MESPSKARTLSKFLGSNYTIEASVGHIRDLPQNDLGVDPDNDFAVSYEIAPEKKKVMAKLRKAVKNADAVYLATDPDREGEAISWHLVEALKIKVPIFRLVFHEFTKTAILKALESPREIDMCLVKAQETRRILDRLVGYEISPILWRRMSPGLSAGRVQSVATKMVVEREMARSRYQASTYWDVMALFSQRDGEQFEASLFSIDDKRIVNGKDFDRETGQLKIASDKARLILEADALKIADDLGNATWKVETLVKKPSTSRPSPPFTTSTMQQAAHGKLRFSSRRTMQVAQRLYEAGYITYMRTDSTSLSSEALNAARNLIKTKFGPEYLPDKPNFYKTKVKNAQEAHEAIRPAGSIVREPETITGLESDQLALYELIYRRTLASQMTPARITQTTADISGGNSVFRATGKVVEFPGFMAVYKVSNDKHQNEMLPPIIEGRTLDCHSLNPKSHATKPPARYTEATLIKELEAQGIGRPSTYASIMDTIQRRAYVNRKGGALVPTFVAYGVIRLMEANFTELVDYQFTARMENVLDEISRGERESTPYLREFYFGENGDSPGLKSMLQSDIDIKAICTITLGESGNRPVTVRIGRYGPYLEHGEDRANLSPELAPADLDLETALEIIKKGSEYPKTLGVDPESGKTILMKSGRFGIYLQLDDEGSDKKPKQKSLLPGMQPADVSLEIAVEILALPKNLGNHPESGEPVLADLGRYGPYVRSGEKSRSLPAGEDLLNLQLAKAVEILAQQNRQGTELLQTLGKHPETGVDVVIKSGRYGPYITDGSTNVSLKKGEDAATVTLDMAVERLAEKAAKGPTKRRRARGKMKKSKKK